MHNRKAFFWRLGVILIIGSLLARWLYGHAFPGLTSLYSLVPFIICPLCFSLAHNAIHAVPVWLAKVFAWIGGLWLVFTLYSFFGLIPFLVVTFFWPVHAAFAAEIIFGLVIIVILYGIWHANHRIVRTISMSSPKITTPCTIAFLTDIHLSPLLSHQYTKQLVRHIQSLHADAIIFGGDLIDAHLDFVLRDGAYNELNTLQAPLGVWAVYGNHDYFDSSITKEQEALKSIHFLKNETVTLRGNISLTGLNDYLHEPTHAVVAPPDNTFSILIDHEPLRIIPASKAGYDVYLAGHTHGGQFFPVTEITKRLFTLSYGQRQFGNLTAIVSSGYGYWGMPMRTGPSPEIIVLKLSPEYPQT